MLASLADSLADLVGAAVTFISVRISQRPADASHRFGHGKVEALSALVQASIVTGSAVFIMIDAITRFGTDRTVDAAPFALAVMIFSTGMTLALIAFQKRVVERAGSQAIAADRMHYAADFTVNLGVITALVGAWIFHVYWLDSVIAVAIGIYLVTQAYLIAREAIDTLMDKELSAEDRARIEALVRAEPGVDNTHDLRTRTASGVIFIELHVEIEGRMPLEAVHDVTDRIENVLEKAFPSAEIMLHPEPTGLDDTRLDDRIAIVEQQRR